MIANRGKNFTLCRLVFLNVYKRLIEQFHIALELLNTLYEFVLNILHIEAGGLQQSSDHHFHGGHAKTSWRLLPLSVASDQSKKKSPVVSPCRRAGPGS